MPFLENAFIYGKGFLETPGIIISLKIIGNNLSFEVMNYIMENTNKVKPEEGFSVKSIKRFLDLQFGNDYNLEIKNEDKKYLVTLDVKLS